MPAVEALDRRLDVARPGLFRLLVVSGHMVFAVTGAVLSPAVSVSHEQLATHWPTIVRLAWFFAGVLVVILVGTYVLEPAVLRLVRQRNRNNPTIREAISRYLRVVVVVLAVLFGAGAAGYGQFLTDSALVIAAGTLAVGVAAQSVIGSLVSGIVLVFDPQFNIGNYIEWEDGEGTVRSITLRVTRVQTPAGELVTVPNTVLTSQAITRPFGQGGFQVVELVEVGYEDDVDEALAALEAAAAELDAVLEAPNPNAYVDELGDDGVVLRVHYWIADPDRREVIAVRSQYARGVKARLEAEGIDVSPASKRDLDGRIEVADPAR